MEGLAEAWEGVATIRGRFRREISWIQFPLKVVHTVKGEKGDLHAPTTRAIELNVELLSVMLKYCSFEFVDIVRLQRQAGCTFAFLNIPCMQCEGYVLDQSTPFRLRGSSRLSTTSPRKQTRRIWTPGTYGGCGPLPGADNVTPTFAVKLHGPGRLNLYLTLYIAHYCESGGIFGFI